MIVDEITFTRRWQNDADKRKAVSTAATFMSSAATFMSSGAVWAVVLSGQCYRLISLAVTVFSVFTKPATHYCSYDRDCSWHCKYSCCSACDATFGSSHSALGAESCPKGNKLPERIARRFAQGSSGQSRLPFWKEEEEEEAHKGTNE
jgi:hypothetical protein